MMHLLMARTPCRQIAPRLWDYHRGALDSVTADRVSSHLARCPACKSEMQFIHRAFAVAAAISRSVPSSAKGWQDIRDAIGEPCKSRRHVRPFLVAGAIGCAAVFTIFALYSRPSGNVVAPASPVIATNGPSERRAATGSMASLSTGMREPKHTAAAPADKLRHSYLAGVSRQRSADPVPAMGRIESHVSRDPDKSPSGRILVAVARCSELGSSDAPGSNQALVSGDGLTSPLGSREILVSGSAPSVGVVDSAVSRDDAMDGDSQP